MPDTPAGPPVHKPGLPEPGVLSRVRDADRTTRKPLAFWDRCKFLLLLFTLFWFFVWADMADNPILPFQDALNRTFEAKWWLVALFGVELIRQAHFLLAETWPSYHRMWSDSIFGRFERRMSRFNDWNRYRIARIVKLIVALVLLSLVLAAIFDVSPATAIFELPAKVISALPQFAQFLIYPLVFISQFGLLFWFLSHGGVDVYYPDDIETRLDDVWGQDPVVERVRENMLFLEEPEKIEEKGGYVPGGILLWGPPGTGKTLMAEAVAGETGKPFVFVDPGAFINMFMGVGIIKVKSLFRKLRKLALRYGGVIVFFDEADSLGSRSLATQGGLGDPMASLPWDDHARWLSPASQELLLTPGPEGPEPKRGVMMMGGGGGGGMGTLQALLTELSGLKKPRGILNRYGRRVLGLRPKPPPKYRILVMMATNMPQALDEALLRPGRLDRIYKVGYPSKEGRKRTYQGYFDKVSHDLTDDEFEKLATMTPYATGATIKDLVNEALIVAIREGRDVISWRDVLEAKKLKDLGPPEDVEYIERERHAIAIHEACHAIAFHRETRHLSIDLATIEKGSTYLGFVRGIRVEDQFTRWRSHYEADIKVSLASLAGEREFFDGDNSSGVSGDLAHATTIATQMEGYWGMGSTIAVHGVTHAIGVGGGGRKPPEDEEREKELLKDATLGQRIEDQLGRLMDETEALIRDNRHEILAIAHALETHKTIPGEDVVAIIEGRDGTLVDGRLYHDESARQLLEEYHETAKRAHRDNASVDARLPVLTNGHRPVAAAAIPPPPD